MQARRLPARQGMVWVASGYRLYRANPSLLTVLSFAYLMVFVVMLVLPAGIGGILFPFVQPLTILIIANGCRAIATNGKPARPDVLLTGMKPNIRPLFKLGALQLCGSLLVMMALIAANIKPDADKPEAIVQAMALAMALSLPLLLAFWFAPLLTGWHGLPPLKAAFFSLIACFRNWRAFLAYGITLATAALLPAVLAVVAMQVSDVFGQFVAKTVEIMVLVFLLPIVLTGSYVSYRDIFTAADADA